jgi:phosphate-selective porin OprO/OprP
MFNADYTPAVTLSGQVGKWSYYTGIFSNATGTDMGKAFTDFDSGYSLLASVTVDLADKFHTDTAFLNFCYLHSDANVNATNLNRFDNGISTALILTKGSGSLVTEVTAGLGAEAGNAVGLNLQPGLFLTDKLQIVGRYQLAGSDGKNGLQPQRRYERPAGMRTGDLYQAVCLGLNYYILGHRLKLMGGVEYATLGGRDVWTSYVAVRTFWGPHSRAPFPSNSLLPGLIH